MNFAVTYNQSFFFWQPFSSEAYFYIQRNEQTIWVLEYVWRKSAILFYAKEPKEKRESGWYTNNVVRLHSERSDVS